MNLPSREPAPTRHNRTMLRAVTALGLLLCLAACTPDSGAKTDRAAGSDAPASVASEEQPQNASHEALDQLAELVGADSDLALEQNSDLFKIIESRRVDETGVEAVYVFRLPVDATATALGIADNSEELDAYVKEIFIPKANELGLPYVDMMYSYFQPDGEHIVTLVCSDFPEDDWRHAAAGKCIRDYGTHERYEIGG